MELKVVRLEIPENGNIIVGQSHFIKTVEDLYEAMVNTVPGIKFGIAFNEASGACLTRVDGNDDALKANATRNAQSLAAGHVFVVALRDGFPINVLGRIREIPEVCSIFCATANPVEMILAETGAGTRGSGRNRRQLAQGRGRRRGGRVAARIPAENRVQTLAVLFYHGA